MKIRQALVNDPQDGSFDLQHFVTPDAKHAPYYSWVWNAPVTKEETDRQLAEMERLGIRQMYVIPEPTEFRPPLIPTRLDPAYLSHAYMDELRYATEEAAKRGIGTWLYNEGGWPSGGACGRVVMEDPSLGCRALEKQDLTLPAGVPYTRTSPDLIGAFVGDKPVEEGAAFPVDTVVSEYRSVRRVMTIPGLPDLPDLTRAEATDSFIGITHEAYDRAMGDLFGNTIRSVFTDEPVLRQLMYHEEIERAFEKKTGYSPRPYLPAFLNPEFAVGKAAEARVAYFELLNELFCENYLLREKNWVNAHGMTYVGHMDRDHDLLTSNLKCSYGALRALRQLDIPGVDVIWRQIWPKDEEKTEEDREGMNHFFPRLASSAARQVGSPYALSESFCVYGMGLSTTEMRYVVGFQWIRGINRFNFMVIPYGRRDFYLAGELPSFIEAAPNFRELPTFNRYVERLSYLGTLGERVCNVALYQPTRDVWLARDLPLIRDAYESAGVALENGGVDFDIVDDDWILNVDADALDDGKLTLGDCTYTKVVVPPCRMMKPEAIERLCRFANGGGVVVLAGEGPFPAIGSAATVSDLNGYFPADFPVKDRDGIRTMRRSVEGGALLFFFNESCETRTCYPDLASRNVTRLYPEDGTTCAYESSYGLTLTSGETAVLYVPELPFPSEHRPIFRERIALSFTFEVEPVERMCLQDHVAARVPCHEAPCRLPLGDLSGAFGTDFSGTVRYSGSFSLTSVPSGGTMLSLGKVSHTARVLLNGVDLGVRIFPPFDFRIPAGLLKSENTLEILVTGTAAALYRHTDFFSRYPSWVLTNYFEKETVFAQSTEDTGLYGPVVLMY